MATLAALSVLVEQTLADVAASRDLAALDEVRVRLLGKKGALTDQLKSLGSLPAAERPAAGQECVVECAGPLRDSLVEPPDRLDQGSLHSLTIVREWSQRQR